MNEFELIARYFDRRHVSNSTGPGPARVLAGIGDDCALLAPRTGHALAVSTDLLVAGRHFEADGDPAALGWKTLAVNLSDLAAMGARPLAFTLGVALPSIDEAWLDGFSHGLFDCATRFDCPLVGGDTTRGPLTLCVTIFGEVEAAHALRRDAARVGDDIWVSGTVGAAALVLARRRRDASDSTPHGHDVPPTASRGDDCPDGRGTDRYDARGDDALDRPLPRIALGLALRGVAHAAIDVSDGLAQDLGHLLVASRCGAALQLDALPLVDDGATDLDSRRRLALTGGDDYELCFTAPGARRDAVGRAAAAAGTRVTRIGRIVDGSGLHVVDGDGRTWPDDGAPLSGYDHFA